jgi:hypothetical protein
LLKAPLELNSLALGDGADDMTGNVVRGDDIAVEHFRAPAGDCTHGELGLPGHSEFTDDEHIERRLQSPRDFEGNRHTSARQRKDDHIFAVLILCELPSQQLARLTAIPKPVPLAHPGLLRVQR